MGCTRVAERVCAALGALRETPTRFETSLDVCNGGVLWAVPALLANGLLRHTEACFSLPKGFYGCIQVFLLLAFMALARIKSIEELRYCPAGEWGKLLGLDRIPEARTLRSKVKALAQPEEVCKWGDALSLDWMKDEPEAAGILYADGHMRPYHGSQTKLPRRYMSRERLCLRGTTDYWVNDREGRPFFVVSTPFTSGLLSVLEEEIVPRLLEDVPKQPSPAELEANPRLHRFTLVFDREGYSPDFFARMLKLRIACQTYHKYPKEDWRLGEFFDCTASMPHGQEVTMKLAERGVKLNNGLWVREIRKLTETGHQTSILSTDYVHAAPRIAAHMFARWCQENFFRYMLKHYNLNGLIDYQTEGIDETQKVVNPAWRNLDGQIRSKAGKLNRMRAEFGEIVLSEELKSKNVAAYERRKGMIIEGIDLLEKDLAALKEQRKKTDKHIQVGELPEAERFAQLAPTRKQFIDTIKMIAYRAETALVITLRDVLARPDDARSLLREIFTTEADIIPDEEAGTLTVRLHHLANRLSDEAARHLAAQLNASETQYPGTNLRLIFELVSNPNPPDQEV
ncbi:MAG: putative transposase [bacterium]